MTGNVFILYEENATKELPTLLRDEASVYFNVIMVESMTSGVMSVQHQCSIHDYKVLPVPFDISFCFLTPLVVSWHYKAIPIC